MMAESGVVGAGQHSFLWTRGLRGGKTSGFETPTDRSSCNWWVFGRIIVVPSCWERKFNVEHAKVRIWKLNVDIIEEVHDMNLAPLEARGAMLDRAGRADLGSGIRIVKGSWPPHGILGFCPAPSSREGAQVSIARILPPVLAQSPPRRAGWLIAGLWGAGSWILAVLGRRDAGRGLCSGLHLAAGLCPALGCWGVGGSGTQAGPRSPLAAHSMVGSQGISAWMGGGEVQVYAEIGAVPLWQGLLVRGQWGYPEKDIGTVRVRVSRSVDLGVHLFFHARKGAVGRPPGASQGGGVDCGYSVCIYWLGGIVLVFGSLEWGECGMLARCGFGVEGIKEREEMEGQDEEKKDREDEASGLITSGIGGWVCMVSRGFRAVDSTLGIE
ncbi:hypothetical protein Tco_0725145 [Tanacetum coccineum]|uniref:Uncharacterized protein n=1 Tax=Tanacetum coccineum TaxID=301880 RepID=A0ABQ4YC17_9ASTR